jgi:enamine deaminase RidA (YjgF/YER057c/UK114 family)
MTKKLVNPDQLYDGSHLGMSQAVIDNASSLVFVSGQVAWDLDRQVSDSTVSGQFEAAMNNLHTALAASGASIDSVLHLRIYVRGEVEDHMESLAPVMNKHLGKSRPAVTGVGVASLASKGTLVEVEAIARVRESVSPRDVA